MVKGIRLIPTAGYLRVSDDDKQVASIPDQRTAVLDYAARHGYEIIRWYIDEGISGDDTENREAFLRMRDDTKDRGDFKAVLSWSQDRFGRFNQMDAGYWTYPFRKAGVYLVTCDMGRIDWETDEGQLIYGVNQMGKHKFLKDLSRNVARGQLEAAKKGSWLGSRPYGYRIVGPKKDKRLIYGDPSKVVIVQRIFREYVVLGLSRSEIARRLNAEGVVCPGGPAHRWRHDSVRVILENPAYCGDVVDYRYSYGKYHQVHGEQITKGGKRQRNPKEDWVITKNKHEAIIDRPTWESAQALLARGKTGRSKYSPEENPYVFSGMLRCGKCGANLNGLKNGKGHRYYECRAHFYHGVEHCLGTAVREDRLLKELGTFLMDWLGIDGDALGEAAYNGALKPEDVPEAFKKVHKLIVPPPRPQKERDRLSKELKQIVNRLAKARANLPLLDAENIPAAQAVIRQLDARRQEIDKELAESKPPMEADVNRLVLGTIDSLYTLATGCLKLAQKDEPGWHTFSTIKDEAPGNIRRFFGLGYFIRIHTKRSGKGSGVRHRFIKGELVFQPIGGKGSEKVVGVNAGELNPHHQV